MQLDDISKPSLLALADGSLFYGHGIGKEGITSGEVVFNTAMSGYQEIMTDPSYAKQIVTFTYPHLGNVGTNQEDEEAGKVWVSGIIVHNLSTIGSNWRSNSSLSDYLQKQNITGIANIDTRCLTRLLRDKGAQSGCVMVGVLDPERAIKLAQEAPSLEGLDLTPEVTTAKPYEFLEGSWVQGEGYKSYSPGELKYHVVVFDYGVKRNILRLLVDQGCRLTVLPALAKPEEALALKPDGIFLSNGPGDPKACHEIINNVKALTESGVPLFGICLGCQLLALASGADTFKMKFGHHGANHPVISSGDQQVMVTSQNHGFAIDEDSLPKNIEVTHRSLFDNTIQGISRTDTKAIAFQGHPEASPGPHDMSGLFKAFKHLMDGY